MERQSGRVNQRTRTRADLVHAAREIVAEGRTPTVVESAERALVSVATAYRYFSTQHELLDEAALSPLLSALDAAAGEAERIRDPEEALVHFIAAFYAELGPNESAFRRLFGESLSAPPTEGLRQEIERGVGRTGLRPEWLRRVLHAIDGEIDKRQMTRLIQAITALIGIEALAALRDVCGTSLAEAEETVRWAAVAVLREARRSSKRAHRGKR